MANNEMNYIESLENLFNALEIYRDMQEKLISRAEEILKEHGLSLKKTEIAGTNADEIRRRLHEEAERRKEREMAMVAENGNDYHTSDTHIQEKEREESRCLR